MMEKRKQWKGFTDFQLKWLALVLMVFDHIHYFFEFTGKVPEWFSMLGRLSAPLFLFCLLEGFAHTRNRKNIFCGFMPLPWAWERCNMYFSAL